MKERPIIFNTENVRAILSGRKIQTRRVIKPQPDEDGLEYDLVKEGWFDTSEKFYKCPYGIIGDHLWVRESFRLLSISGGGDEEEITICYRALGGSKSKKRKEIQEKWQNWRFGKYTPSIFMPRWASRITLEVCDIGVQRIKEISPEDCNKEGVEGILSARDNFKEVWDLINAKRGFGWDKNVWVWVVKFNKL